MYGENDVWKFLKNTTQEWESQNYNKEDHGTNICVMQAVEWRAVTNIITTKSK